MEIFQTIDEVVDHCGSQFQMLIKFGSKENLESLQSGTVYMKNLEYYNNLEQKDGSGKPDKYDGKWKIRDMNLTFISHSAGMPSFQCKADSSVISFGIGKYFIFCLFSFDKRNCQQPRLDEQLCMITAPVTFTDEQR